MGDSPESMVRSFFAAWTDPDPTKLARFFGDDAEWVDGPQGVRRGVEAIRDELTSQLTAVGGVTVEVRTLLSSGRRVMVEQISNSVVNGRSISAVVMAVFELGSDGRFTQWREAYDLTSVLDQIRATH